MVGRNVPHQESCLGVMQRTLETMAGVQRLQGDRAWNRQRRSLLMKRPFSLIFCVVVFCGTSYKDGVIHVHIVGWLFELWGLSSFD